MLRVLHAFKSYTPERGGIVTAVRALAKGLQGAVQSHVLVTGPRGSPPAELGDGVRITRVRAYSTVMSTPVAPAYPIALARAAKWADVVAFHYPFPLADPVLADVLPASTGLVVHWHSDIVSQARAARAVMPFTRRVLARADRIVLGTPFLLENSPLLRPHADKCEIVTYGIDAGAWSSLDAEEEKQVEACRERFGEFVLTVGRLVPYKGTRHLLDAMKDIDAPLVIAGDGPLRSEIEAEVRKGGRRRPVTLLGDVPRSELKILYNACRLFVLPSSAANETFGIVQLEAMACGKPVINTDAHPGPAWVARNGREAITVRAGDPQAMAAALKELLVDDQKSSEMGEAARRRAHEDFALKPFLDSVLAIYREAAEQRSQKRQSVPR